jgi:hypothetical protein
VRASPAARRVATALLPALVLCAAGAALAAKPKTRVEIRVIEAVPGVTDKPVVDKKLSALARDLKSLPFKEYKLRDAHQKNMTVGERVSFQFPGPKGENRFLVVSSHGEQSGGKLRFQLTIKELKFDTLVAVPEGGTLLVGGPRYGKSTIFFAVTAKKSVKTRGRFKR